jgi:putative intracellular protease/amidase
MRYEILLNDGFDELDALGPWEILSGLAKDNGDLEAALVSLDGERAHGSAAALAAEQELEYERRGTLWRP